MKKYGKILMLLAVLSLIALFFVYDLKQFLTLEYIKSQKDQFATYSANNFIQTISIYMAAYILITALSLPGAALLTLLGGALFGVVNGTIIVSFASTIGATVAFLVSRFLLKDWVQQKFSEPLEKINKGVREEGAFYLFTLRLIPVVPFFVINLAMGLTPIKVFTFYIVSQVGMLAGTIVFVNAGTQLSQIESLSGILSPGLLLSFCLLGAFPIVTKKIMKKIRSKKGNVQNA